MTVKELMNALDKIDDSFSIFFSKRADIFSSIKSVEIETVFIDPKNSAVILIPMKNE